MIKRVLGSAFIFSVILSACTNSPYIENQDGTFTHELELNDSIIKRTHLGSDRIKTAVEYENTKGKTVKIYYFDATGAITQSLEHSTVDPTYYQNHVYQNGRIVEKILKNGNKEVLYRIKYDASGNLLKKSFYREGQQNINAFVSFNESGEPDLSYRKSHFLKLLLRDDTLRITPVGLPGEFQSATVFQLEGFPEFPDSEMSIKKKFEFDGRRSYIGVALADLTSENVRFQLRFLTGSIEGNPEFMVYELYLKDTDSIPRNNLYPIYASN